MQAEDKRKENELCARIEQILAAIAKTENQRKLAELYNALEQVLAKYEESKGICREKSILPKTQ